MSELFDKKCVPCEGGVPALDISCLLYTSDAADDP